MRLSVPTYLIVFLAFSFLQCQPEEPLTFDYLPPATTSTEIDQWLLAEYTTPYNIWVDYKWRPYEVDPNRVLVPPKESVVMPVMQLIKDTWIQPYAENAGEDFIKQLAPKHFVLVGSAQYNNDGTIVLGEAESGRKVTLFKLNDFSLANTTETVEMLHTIHHEFAHIMHQTILYPQAYKQLTPQGYTASWYNTSNEDALDLGFISPYARASADEDFVEMIAAMLTMSSEAFDDKVNSASPAGKASLLEKKAMVVNYFKTAWNIDFQLLRASTYAAIERATNPGLL